MDILNKFLGLYLVAAIAVFAYMAVWFFFGLLRKRNDVADEAWGLGFIFISYLSLVYSNSFGILNLVVAMLVTLWGLRLFYHISTRHKGKPEDNRYQEFRESWDKYFLLKSFFIVYLFQGFLMLLVSAPIVLLSLQPRSISGLAILGIFIWAIGYIFEVTADAQLRRFMGHPGNKGKLMTNGLWRYSRHPNYFGEVLIWWGIFVISLSTGSWLGVFGPITITYLLVFVSGIPMLEKHYSGRPDWEEYKKKTSALLPLPPK